jgi:hypothetical protein
MKWFGILFGLWCRLHRLYLGITSFYYSVKRPIGYCRVSVFVVTAGALFLLLVDQGKEITVRLGDDNLRQLYFLAAVNFWAWQSWFWSRIILNDRAQERGTWIFNFLIDWLPRILGALAFYFALASMFENRVFGWGFWTLLGSAVFSVAYWIFRRYFRGTLFTIDLAQLKPSSFTKFTRYWIKFSVVVIAVFTIWALSAPLIMGFAIGSGAIVFIALASFAVTGNAAVYLTRKQGFPLFISLLVLLAVWSLTPATDNHLVRSLEGQAGENKPVESVPLGEALKNWSAKKQDSDPLIVVATSGGGSRAAYWTATVLGALQDANPKFSDRLFAISSVSGGSLGAIIFTNLLASKITCDEWQFLNDLGHQTCFEAVGAKALSEDFLAPEITALLYGDLMHQIFFPYYRISDRARALEMGWERRFKEVVGNNLMAEGFRDLWAKSDRLLPSLLLNGTHQETGRRMITSNLDISADYFPDAFGFYEKLNGTKAALKSQKYYLRFAPGKISAATAAHNSSRFPYVSPAGTLGTGGHVLDGGYFENSGAQTLDELLNGIRAELKIIAQSREETPPLPERKILVIQITSAPVHDDILRFNEPAGGGNKNRIINELAAPLRGLLASRGAHTSSAAKTLRNKYWDTGNENRSYAHFRLEKAATKEEQDRDPILATGRVLSKQSECAMRVQLRAIPDNRKAFATVIKALNNGEFPPGSLREGAKALLSLCDDKEKTNAELRDRMKNWSFMPK